MKHAVKGLGLLGSGLGLGLGLGSGLGLGLGLFRTGLMNNRVLRECSKVK